MNTGAVVGFNRDGFLWNYTHDEFYRVAFYACAVASPSGWLKAKPLVKYLKSIRQLLNEYPDAYWDDLGRLHHPSWGDHVVDEMFTYFGGRLDLATSEFNYIPEWIEEREAEDE